MHFLRFLKEDWGAFQNVMYVKGGRKYLKNPCLQNLHRDISFRTQCDKENVEMKVKIRTSLTSTIEVLREEVELSNTRTAYVMHIPNTLSLTSARNNSKQKFQ